MINKHLYLFHPILLTGGGQWRQGSGADDESHTHGSMYCAYIYTCLATAHTYTPFALPLIYAHTLPHTQTTLLCILPFADSLIN